MGLDQEGYSACKTAEFLSLSLRTVSYTIKHYRERGTVENRQRSGPKKKTNVRTDRLLLRMAKTNRRHTLVLPINLIIAHLTNVHKEQSRGVYTMPDSTGEELRSLLRFEVSTEVRGERFADQNITRM
jgi:transposase